MVKIMITFSTYKQHYLLMACIATGIMICFILFEAISQWRNDWMLVHEQPAFVVQADKNSGMDLIHTLPNHHLFGQTLTSGAVPITNLQLRVTGIVMMDNTDYHHESKAYISMAGQASKMYRIGDRLAEGVNIYDITSDSVILENDNHIEKLPLPREKLKFKNRVPL